MATGLSVIIGVAMSWLVLVVSFEQQAYGTESVFYYGKLDKRASRDGMVFSAWGGESNKMFIRDIDNGTNKAFRVQGTTGNSAAGFSSQPLNYSSEYVILSVGNVSAFSNHDPLSKDLSKQVSFVFHLIRQQDQQADLRFVVGDLYTEEGWEGSHYYKKISPNSSYKIGIPEGCVLAGISLGIQKETTVNPLDFILKLDHS